jgi:hypothetical protein
VISAYRAEENSMSEVKIATNDHNKKREKLVLICCAIVAGLMTLGAIVGDKTPPSSTSSTASGMTIASTTTSLQDLDECLDFYGHTTPDSGNVTVSRRIIFPCPVMPPQQMFNECRAWMESKIKIALPRDNIRWHALDIRLACVDKWQDPAVRQQWYEKHREPKARKWTDTDALSNGEEGGEGGKEDWKGNCVYLITGSPYKIGDYRSFMAWDACGLEWSKRWG